MESDSRAARKLVGKLALAACGLGLAGSFPTPSFAGTSSAPRSVDEEWGVETGADDGNGSVRPGADGNAAGRAPDPRGAPDLAEAEPVEPVPEYRPIDSSARSYFGDAPDPHLGVGRDYGARAIAAEESGPRDVSRGPASLPAGPVGPYDLPVDANLRKGKTTPHSVLRNLIQKRGVQEISLIAGDLGFFPKTVFATRDIPVRIFVTGASRHTLCLVMDSYNVRKQVRAQAIEEITFLPDVPGTFRFYCPINGTEGTLVVRELASASKKED